MINYLMFSVVFQASVFQLFFLAAMLGGILNYHKREIRKLVEQEDICSKR